MNNYISNKLEQWNQNAMFAMIQHHKTGSDFITFRNQVTGETMVSPSASSVHSLTLETFEILKANNWKIIEQ